MLSARSKIEEILAVYGGGHSFRTDRHLVRLADDYEIYDFDTEAGEPFAASVASVTAGIFECLDSAETNDNDRFIQEDPPSDSEDGETSSAPRNNTSVSSIEGANGSQHEAAENLTDKKLWPKIKFVTFEKRYEPRVKVHVPETL